MLFYYLLRKNHLNLCPRRYCCQLPSVSEQTLHSISLCSQGFYHKPFEARLIATVHRAWIVGIGLVILLFHVVKIVHYLHHLVFGTVLLLQRRTKKAIGLGMTGITLLDMLD